MFSNTKIIIIVVLFFQLGFVGLVSAQDIAVNISGPVGVPVSTTVTYKIYVTNNGTTTASAVNVKVPVVANFTASSVSCANGPGNNGSSSCPGTVNVATLQGAGLSITNLPSGSALVFTVTGTSGSTTSNIAYTATVTSAGDPITSNNSATFNTYVYSACGTATTTTYNLDLDLTAANNSVALNGGTINLYFSRTGPAIAGLANPLIIPVTYSDLIRNAGTGVNHQWYSIVNETTGTGIGLNLGMATYDDNSTSQTADPGSIYGGLPASNIEPSPLPYFGGTRNIDGIFTEALRSGTIAQLGAFTLNFANITLPTGVRMTSKSLILQGRGSGNGNMADDAFVSGYYAKPMIQNVVTIGTNQSVTPEIEMEFGQVYTWKYTAYSTTGYPRQDFKRGVVFTSGTLTFAVDTEIPTITTAPAMCGVAAAGMITNYVSGATYTFSPTGPTVGAGGVISGLTGGTNYTVTATVSGCTSNPSASFSVVTTMIDTDGDGVSDDCDLDDDNDGILDAVESPNCFYTSAEAHVITSITSPFNGAAGDPSANNNIPILTNGNTADAGAAYNFEAGQTITPGSPIFTVTYLTNIVLSTLTVRQTASGMMPATRYGVLYGSKNGINYTAISGTGVLLNATSVTFTVSGSTPYRYYQIRYIGTVSGGNGTNGTLGTANISEIEFVPNTGVYVPSASPKPGNCATDFDNDTMPNHLDTDADGDGCPDVVEGGANFQSGASYITSDRLNTAVNASGVPGVPVATPTITGYTQAAGQTIGQTLTVNPVAVAGTASADQTIAPSTAPTALSLTGSTGTIQWQVSTDNVAFANVASGGASASYAPGPLSTTTYYRAVLTSVGGCTVLSNVVTITVCGAGTVAPNFNDLETTAYRYYYNNDNNSNIASYSIKCGGGITANLNLLALRTAVAGSPIPATPLPAGATLTWHSDPIATDANQITDPLTAVTGATREIYAAFRGGANCYSPTRKVSIYAPICANNDDYTATPVTQGVLHTFPSVFTNDTYKNVIISTLPPDSVGFNYSNWVPANANINFSTGVITVPTDVLPGIYSYSYRIVDIDPDGVVDSNASYASVTFRVIADSDGDGIHDEDDLDDDNDGILDKNECIGFIANNVSGVWKGRTSSNITVTASPNTTQSTAQFADADPQVSFSVNQNGGDQRFGNSATAASYVITFSTPVPANEIGLMINDVNVGATFSPLASFKIDVDFGLGVGFENPQGRFIRTLAGRQAGVDYNELTGIPSFQASPNPDALGGEDIYLKGIGNTLIKAVRIVGSNLSSGGGDLISYSFFAQGCDTDGDGTPDYLDVDSDGDGCYDAFEGDENVLASHLRVFGDINVAANGGVGSTPNVNNGVPNLVNSGGTADIGGDVGQGIGYSTNSSINLCCMNLPTAGTPDNYTQTGISNLAGFGTTGNGWPQNVPNGFVAIESRNQGFVITRVANTSAIATPVEGMLIYDISASCVKLYNGTIWKCLAKDCN